MQRKHLITLSALGAFAGMASAQSSVTLLGTVDLNVRVVKTDGQSRRFTQNASGINSGQFGVRGEEDLGGGLKAGFLLLSEAVADAGLAGDGSRNKFWNRQAFVKLAGPWGEVRLGRDYTPSYWSHGVFDAFGNLGLGNMLNIHQMYGGSRIDNSVGYVLPSGLGGFYGDAKVAMGEAGTTLDRPGRYTGVRFGYANGPINIAVAAGQQKFAVNWPGLGTAVGTGAPAQINGALVPTPAGTTQKTYNIGASYDFGVVKLMAFYDREDLQAKRENLYSVSAVAPIGGGDLRIGYARSNFKNGVTTTIDQMSLGYVYYLSKRTAIYTTISRLDNKDGTRTTLPSSAIATPGGKSQGADIGIRHFF